MVEQHVSDDAPEFDASAVNGQSANGAQPAGKRPSQSQLLVSESSNTFFNLPEELLKGDADFSKLIPKGDFTPQEGAAMLRLLVDEDQYDDGNIDAHRVVYWKVLFSMAEGGKATSNAIRANGGGQMFRAGLAGVARGFGFGQPQTNGTAQREGPS